jgi:predicted metal-dependent phosphoesterase TrpH
MPRIKLNDNNTWLIISLIFTSIFAPILVWHYQQANLDDANRTIEAQKLELEKQKLELDVNNQVVSLYEQMRVLISQQQSLAQRLITSKDHNEKVVIRDKRDAIRKQLNLIEEMLMKHTGKTIEEIRPQSAPMPPTIISVQ